MKSSHVARPGSETTHRGRGSARAAALSRWPGTSFRWPGATSLSALGRGALTAEVWSFWLRVCFVMGEAVFSQCLHVHLNSMGQGGTPATASDTRHNHMDGEDDVAPEDDPPIDERTRKRRQCNNDRRERIGDIAFRREKAAARKTQRAAKRQKAAEQSTQAGAAGAVPLPTAFAMPLPATTETPVIDIAGQLERVFHCHCAAGEGDRIVVRPLRGSPVGSASRVRRRLIGPLGPRPPAA